MRNPSIAAALLLALSFGLTACGSQNVAGNATATTATPKAAIRWSQTAAPQGVDVPGAQWLKIEGAGGKSTNVQVAAVLRPQGPGPFPLVVWFSSPAGLLVDDVSAAAHLTPAGFMVLVSCWTFTPTEAFVYEGVSYQTIPCLKNFAGADDAVRAVIEVGHQLPGVKKDAIGLFGGSVGGRLVLQYTATSTDIRAVVADSSPSGNIRAIVADSSPSGPSKVNAPVLMLGGTADPFVPIQAQRDYEQTLRNSGSTVEAHYYEGGMHEVTSYGDFQKDAIKRIIDFYRRYLK